jgi:hypothetical protein
MVSFIVSQLARCDRNCDVTHSIAAPLKSVESGMTENNSAWSFKLRASVVREAAKNQQFIGETTQ